MAALHKAAQVAASVAGGSRRAEASCQLYPVRHEILTCPAGAAAQVAEAKLWATVARALGAPDSMTDKSFKFKRMYTETLALFERARAPASLVACSPGPRPARWNAVESGLWIPSPACVGHGQHAQGKPSVLDQAQRACGERRPCAGSLGMGPGRRPHEQALEASSNL